MESVTASARLPRAQLGLLLAAALLFFSNLGATGLWAPDEPRFAAVSEELRSLKHGAQGLVVLHLNAEPYTQKPPLYYWATALLGAVPGRVSEVVARLPSALAGIGCIWLTAQLAGALSRKPSVGLISGAVLLTVFRFAHFARRAQLDVILSFFVLLALYSLFRLSNIDTARRRWFYVLHAALALAVLTKGPVGLLPIPAFALYLAWQRDLKAFPRVFPIWSFAISLGPALVWMSLAVALAPAGFFEEAVIDNLFGRFFGGTAHVRNFFYYFVHFPLEFLPWSLLWPIVAVWARRVAVRGPASLERDTSRLLLVWIGVCFVFFSISAGKRGLYLLPVYPAVAILCALAIEDFLSRRTKIPAAIWGMSGAIACVGFGFGCFVFFSASGGYSPAAYPGFRLSPGFGALLAALSGLGLVATFASSMRRVSLEKRLLVPLVGIYLLELLVFSVAYPGFDAEKSPEPIARAAAASSAAGSPVGVFDHTALVAGVAYYSGRPVLEVRDLPSLREFLAAGGQSIIVKESKLDRVRSLGAFEIRARSRSGSRRLLVIGPSAETAGGLGSDLLSLP